MIATNYFKGTALLMVDLSKQGARTYRDDLPLAQRSRFVDFPIRDLAVSVPDLKQALHDLANLDLKIDAEYEPASGDKVPAYNGSNNQDITHHIKEAAEHLKDYVRQDTLLTTQQIESGLPEVLLVDNVIFLSPIALVQGPELEMLKIQLQAITPQLTCQQRVWNPTTGEWEWEYNYTIVVPASSPLGLHRYDSINIANRFTTLWTYPYFLPTYRIALRAVKR